MILKKLGYYQIKKARNGRFWVSLFAIGNRERLLSSQTFASKQAAFKNIAATIRVNFGTHAFVIDLTDKKRERHYTVYPLTKKFLHVRP